MNILKEYQEGKKPQDNSIKLKPGQTGTYGPAGDADPDQLTFKEAFAAFKRAGVKTFKWRGKSYTTETKDEQKSKYDTPENRKKMGKMKKEWKKGARESNQESLQQMGENSIIRQYNEGGTTDDKEKVKVVQSGTKLKEGETPTGGGEGSVKDLSTTRAVTTDDKTADKLPRQESERDIIVRPTERSQRRVNMSDEKRAKLEAKEQSRAEKNRERDAKRMSRMDDRQKRKWSRQQARQERKMERQQMRTSRREQRHARRTARKMGREERRAARGMEYTGGRWFSPRRWSKNLRDKLGMRVKQGSGRLHAAEDYRHHNVNPAYYETEGGDPLSRRTRKGRIRKNPQGDWATERGSVTRYKAGGMVTDAPIQEWDMDKGKYVEVGKKGMIVRKYQNGGTPKPKKFDIDFENWLEKQGVDEEMNPRTKKEMAKYDPIKSKKEITNKDVNKFLKEGKPKKEMVKFREFEKARERTGTLTKKQMSAKRKTQALKKLAKTAGKSAKWLVKRAGWLGMALTIPDAIKFMHKHRKEPIKQLKERARSGSPNIGRKI